MKIDYWEHVPWPPTPFSPLSSLPPSQSRVSFPASNSIHLFGHTDIYTVAVINKQKLILLCGKNIIVSGQSGRCWWWLIWKVGGVLFFFSLSLFCICMMERNGGGSGAEVIRETQMRMYRLTLVILNVQPLSTPSLRSESFISHPSPPRQHPHTPLLLPCHRPEAKGCDLITAEVPLIASELLVA